MGIFRAAGQGNADVTDHSTLMQLGQPNPPPSQSCVAPWVLCRAAKCEKISDGTASCHCYMQAASQISIPAAGVAPYTTGTELCAAMNNGFLLSVPPGPDGNSSYYPPLSKKM